MISLDDWDGATGCSALAIAATGVTYNSNHFKIVNRSSIHLFDLQLRLCNEVISNKTLEIIPCSTTAIRMLYKYYFVIISCLIQCNSPS